MKSNPNIIDSKHAEDRSHLPGKIYFSCPKFTVLLAVEGPVIVKAAPMVKAFEGQTIGALTNWARTKFGGPIVVEKISRSTHQGQSCGDFSRYDSGVQ